jgi:hypothetical protein
MVDKLLARLRTIFSRKPRVPGPFATGGMIYPATVVVNVQTMPPEKMAEMRRQVEIAVRDSLRSINGR